MTSSNHWVHILMSSFENINVSEVGEWLSHDWNLSLKNVIEEDQGFSFNVDDFVTVKTYISSKTIDQSSYSMAIINNYTWQNIYTEKDLYTHDIKVTFHFTGGTKVENFSLQSKIIASMLKSLNHSLAVYVESAIMVVDRATYLDRVNLMNEGYLPVDLWLYIGIGKHEYNPIQMDYHFAFTYGFHSFDKKEIEVPNTKLDIGDLYSFFGNIIAYILTHDIELKDGHVLTYQNDDRIPVELSPGSFISVETFKLSID